MLNPRKGIIGKKIIYLREVSSTNDYAKSIASETPEGTVVVAERQTRGRGRRDREWASPEGGLWMSVILKPRTRTADIPKIVFIGALAVVDALSEFGIEAGIKWPNDVWANGKKICGILTEGRLGEFVILGIGLNVNNEIPPGLEETATSMKLLLGREVSLDGVLQALLKNLDRWYGLFLKGRMDAILSAVKERCFVLGRNVKITDGKMEMVGMAVDIEGEGALVLETPGGRIRVFYGDVSLRFE